MKKAVCIILVLALSFGLSIPTLADQKSTDVSYAVTGGNIWFDKITGTITDCDRAVTEVIIPETIEGVTVKGIGYNAFYEIEKLTSVSMPNSITSIAEGAFHFCYKLNNVNFSNSLRQIGDSAFSGCGNIEYVKLPESLISIGKDAFSGCSGLRSIYIPDGVVSIGAGAFLGCSSLTDVRLSKIEEISAKTFRECKSLKTLHIPDSVTSIGEEAFWDCKNLIGINIPDSVTNIDRCAFANCVSLTAVSIPASVTRIPRDMFWNCTSLTSVGIPVSITEVEFAPFEGCIQSIHFYYGGDEERFNSMTEDLGVRGYFIKSNYQINFDNASQNVIHFNSYEDGVLLSQTTVAGFEDVFLGGYFSDAVIWAKNNGITTGKTEKEFGSFDTVTRGQMVTFLWRAMGSPEPATTANPFVDVQPDDYYYKPVLWAVEKTITTGTDSNHFSPNNTCTTGHALTFLWRAIGAPDYTGKGSWYDDAMNWAKKDEIIRIKKSDRSACPRADVVYYLWKVFE